MSRARVKRSVSWGDEVALEHIRMPGAPYVVVTRIFAMRFIKDAGYTGGQLSMERMCYGPTRIDLPLTAPAVAAPFLAAVRRRIRELEPCS